MKKKYKVFNIEFDGADKVGKDSIMRQIFSIAPNQYIPKTRGIISQLAFSKMFNRDTEYLYTDGYLENTLFVLLTVDEDDWKVRCDLTHEHENNKKRNDVDGEIKYKASMEAFDYAYNYIKDNAPESIREKHFMKFNTSETTPIKIIKAVVERLEELNKD